MNELVSVIIPTYSRSVNIRRAINSVLLQTYSNIEIIVVDDNGEGSVEQKETEERIKDFLLLENFFYLKHRVNMNGAAARNTGIKNSHGKYIAFLDDDDEFLPAKVEIQLNALKEKDMSWGGCYCNTNVIAKRKHVIRNETSGNLMQELLLGRVRFNSSTLLLRKEVCLALGGFDETFTRHQDWEFMIRFFRSYKLYLPTTDSLVNKYASMGNLSNFPKTLDFIEIKNKFIQKFEKDIDGCLCANKIYHKQWMEIVFSSLYDGYYRLSWIYFLKANSYQGCSFYDVKYISYWILKSLFRKIASCFKLLKRSSKY